MIPAPPGDKNPGSLVTDGAERFGQQQFRSWRKTVQFAGHSFMRRIAFDGEFQDFVVNQAGRGERAAFVLPFGPFDRQLHSLPCLEDEPWRATDMEAPDVMGDELAHQQSHCV